MYLVNERYNVTYSEIVELAPFLFCWAAEASLRRRRDYLRQVEAACDNARTLQGKILHMTAPDFTESEERIAAERKSIDSKDLFGLSSDEYFNGDDWRDNPFATFLYSLTKDMGDDVAFEGYCFRDFPEYRVCAKEALLFTDGDSDLAEHVLQGHVALNEMPKEIREIGKFKEQADWVRSKVDEFRNQMQEFFERSKRGEASR
jgi:hypothetical protein